MKTKKFTYMIRKKTTGMIISRHKSLEAAKKAAKIYDEKQNGREQAEIMDYSEAYYAKMN